MAYDMMKQLEMELAKREQGRKVDKPWWADVAADAIRAIPEQQERVLRWQEMKGEQSRNLMTMRAGDYENIYDNEALDAKIAGLEDYIKGNQSKFNATTLEFSNILVENMKTQRSKNTDWDMKVDMIESMVYGRDDDPDTAGDDEKVPGMIPMIQGLDRTGMIDASGLQKIKDSNILLHKSYPQKNIFYY